MKSIDLGFGAFALEPEKAAGDTVGALDVSVLHRAGVSEAALEIYRQFRSTRPRTDDHGSTPARRADDES